MRPICPACNQRPRAIAYYREDKIYYRSRCETCNRNKRKIKAPVPKWQLTGYKKKPACDRCGFRARYSAQLIVYHVDGNMNNSTPRNLKTICQNCVVEVRKSDLPWRPGDLELDS
jgi:Zn ribbon nucleic-acid-binding protein